jgi:GDP-4-dehydro-6-deoxy-D-mannose reductase
VGTCLVTGAAGFAGQHLLRSLLRADVEVVGGTLDGVAPGPGLLDREEIERVRWMRLDVTSEVQLREVLARVRPDRVFHLAGQASVGDSFSDVVGTWAANATGTLLLLDALSRQAPETSVLVVSSSEVYGKVPEAEQPIPETRAVSPANPYGASKAAAEIVARQIGASSGLRVVIARSFNHTGPGQSNRFALPNWAEQLGRMGRGEAEPVLRVGNLEIRRDMLDVRDVVDAYRLLIDGGEPGGVYNVASGHAHRLREIVDTMVELSGTGARVEVERDRLRPVDTPLIQGDPSRLRAVGWEPRVPLRQTLADLLASTRHGAEHG